MAGGGERLSHRHPRDSRSAAITRRIALYRALPVGTTSAGVRLSSTRTRRWQAGASEPRSNPDQLLPSQSSVRNNVNRVAYLRMKRGRFSVSTYSKQPKSCRNKKRFSEHPLAASVA
jgi:hypothetical protein